MLCPVEDIAGGEIRCENGNNFGLSSVVERRRSPEEKAVLTSW